MSRAEFTATAISVGRAAMLDNIECLSNAAGRAAAEEMTDTDLADVLWMLVLLATR